MFLFSGYSIQSVTIHENFALEKLGKFNLWKFFPLENNPLYGILVWLIEIFTRQCITQSKSVLNNIKLYCFYPVIKVSLLMSSLFCRYIHILMHANFAN